MTTATLPLRSPISAADTLNTVDALPGDLSFDLDVDIDTKAVGAQPAIRSWFICTPGCTSPGGGSRCSFCC